MIKFDFFLFPFLFVKKRRKFNEFHCIKRIKTQIFMPNNVSHRQLSIGWALKKSPNEV
jgi:hypothetical protein